MNFLNVEVAVGKKTILGDINGKNPNSANESLLMFELMELMFKRLEPSSSSYTGHSTCTKFPAKLIIFFFQQALGTERGKEGTGPGCTSRNYVLIYT